ncbi:MAG: hypothetical protein AB1725_07285 [Armatimonadota bacterium]
MRTLRDQMRDLRLAMLATATSMLVLGCGGGGVSVAEGLTGAWRGTFASAIAETGDVLEVQLTVEGNQVTGEFAKLTKSDQRTVYATTNVTGTKEGNAVTLTIDIEPPYAVILFDGILIGNALNGQYTIMQGGQPIETGTVSFNRFAADEVDVSGSWTGTYQVTDGPNQGNSGTWTALFAPVSLHEYAVTGSVSSVGAFEGTAYVVGDSVSFGSLFFSSEYEVTWGATVAGTQMTGTWRDNAGNAGTFTGERVGTSAEKVWLVSHRSGSCEVWRMKADGTELVQVTQFNGQSHFDDIAVNATGTRLCVEYGAELWVMNADGSDVAPLTFGESPTFSPDGSKIAFVSGSTISVINADGTQEQELGKGILASDVAWSPRGDRIAFSDFDELYTVDVETGLDIQLVLEGLAGSLAWHPDGSRIVFSDDDSFADLWIINVDGSGLVQLTNTDTVTERWPTWMPDGSAILFTDEGPGDSGDVFTINPDGSGLRRLTAHPTFDGIPAVRGT